MSEKEETMSEKEETMSEKKESNTSTQTDHVSEDSSSLLWNLFDDLSITDSETNNNNDEEFEEIHRMKEDSKEAFQAFLRLTKEFALTRASSSASSHPKTDPEASGTSKKDTASDIDSHILSCMKTMTDEELREYINMYFEVLKVTNNIESSRKCSRLMEEKKIETEEKEEGCCSKDCSSSKNTQTKAFTNPESDDEDEVTKKYERRKRSRPLHQFKMKILNDIEELNDEVWKRKLEEKRRQGGFKRQKLDLKPPMLPPME